MSRKQRPGYKDAKNIIQEGFAGNGIIAEGTTVPSDGATGYAPGCLWFKRGVTGTGAIYQNIGTASSCDFNLIIGGLDMGALTSTAAELNTLTGILATVTELNRAADVSTRVVAIGPSDSATLAITEAAHDGKTIYLTKTDGWNATLPVPVAGMKFRIIIGATIATASTIKSTAGTQIMIGHATMGNDSTNATVDFQAPAASTFDTINLLGTGNSTGGMEGQRITIEAMSATVWFVEIQGDAAGTEATPFENTVA